MVFIRSNILHINPIGHGYSCSGDGLPMDVPSTEKQPVKRQLDFSPEWVDKLQSILGGSPEKTCWAIQTSRGKTFRVATGGSDLPEIPDTEDFPLKIEPVPEEVLLEEELERLHLQESLLEEEIKLAELEIAQEKEFQEKKSQEMASFLNSTYPASSKLAPSASFLVALSVVPLIIYKYELNTYKWSQIVVVMFGWFPIPIASP